MQNIVQEPIELDNLLQRDLNKHCFINFSKIIKYYINYLQYKVGEIIKDCDNRKWLDKRFSIEQQEKGLLFELEKHKDYLTYCINSSLPCIQTMKINYEIKTSSGSSQKDIVKAKELVLVKIILEFSQPAIVLNKQTQEIKIELPYYITLESEKGWH